MKKILFSLMACMIIFANLFNAAFAKNFDTSGKYNVTDETTLDSALIDTAATTKTLNINSDVTLTNNLSTPSGTTITINGNSKSINGGAKAGIEIPGTSITTINNLTLNNFQNTHIDIDGTTVMGGALYNSTGTVNIYNSNFTNNTASSDGYGGAIDNDDGGIVNIYDSKFSGNKATISGGAIYNSTGTVNIYNSTFTGNTADISGGAITHSDTTTLGIYDSTFGGPLSTDGNSATDGGAIYNFGSLVIKNSTFQNNKATNNGGAIYNNGSSANLTISDSTFTSNSATATSSLGGAIYNTGILTISGSTFGGAKTVVDNITTTYGNSAYDGGAIYNLNTAIISDSIFTSNTASDSGGAIYNTGTATISDSIFTGNTATATSSLGGAIYNKDGTVNISNSTFTDNTASYGGAIVNIRYSTTSGTTTISNSIFSGNTATTTTDVDSDGGAIAVMNNTNLSDAELNAGKAILCLNISDSIFTGNTASTTSDEYHVHAQGGAIYLSNGYESITNSTFTGNSANLGGAIYNYGDNVYITNSTFTGNSANRGGAIYIGSNYCHVYIIADGGNVTFTDNTASAGGAICIDDIATAAGVWLNAGAGKIIFNDSIYNAGYLYINKSSQHNWATGGTITATTGEIILNSSITGDGGVSYIGVAYLVELDGGMLKVTSNGSISTNKLTIAGGVLNLADGAITNNNTDIKALKTSSGSNIWMDANLSDSTSDRINTSSASINGGTNFIFRIKEDDTDSSGTLTVLSSGGLSGLSTTAYTNANKYTLTGNSSSGFDYTKSSSITNGTFYDAAANTGARSFSLVGSDYVLSSSQLGGTVTSGNLTIFGTGTSGYAIDGNNASSILNITGGTVNIDEAVIKNSNSSIGAITNAGTLNIYDSAFNSNHSTDTLSNGGGAICNTTGTLNVFDSVFNANMASLVGGAISSKNTANIVDTTFTNNNVISSSSSNSAEGGAIFSTSTLNITGSTFTGNYTSNSGSASSYGGAISASGSDTEISNATFEGNGIKDYDTTTHTGTTATANGGAIFNNCSDTTIYNSNFNYNAASSKGGAIFNKGALVLNTTTFTSNAADIGGAIFNKGTVIIVNPTFTNNTATTSGGAIYNENGALSIVADGYKENSIFSGNTMGSGASKTANDIYLASGSTLNLNAASGNKITFSSGIASSSTSNAININKSGLYEDTANTTSSPTSGTIVLDSKVTGATLNLYGGTLTLNKDNYLNSTDNLTILSNATGATASTIGGTLNLANGTIGTMSLGTLALTNSANLKLDVDLANSTADKISASNVSGSGKLNISAINLLSNSKTTTTTTSIVDSKSAGASALANAITMSATKAYTPIYQYGITYDGNGNLIFTGGGTGGGGSSSNYNPAILSSPVSANVGAYMSQVATYNEALSRAELFMSLPKEERLLMKQRNMYANVGGNDVQPEVFSPTFLPDEKGGIWFKQYTSFENVPMNNGPNVSNVGYGAMVGADSPMYHLKNGFDGYLTTYVSYNGSHQNYDQVGTNQNGGALGVTGTLYKGNFFTALTASVGDSYGQANTMYGVDNFNTLLAGLAWKSGYNIEMAKGKFIFQPSLLAAYTFANTFDYTTASGVNMTSNPMNAIQIAPGVKLIANLEDGWQPYLACNMVFNIMDTQKFQANDAQLPEMSIAPYVEYGLGVQRRWGERFTGFAQAMLRGGGRNGIAIQFGFRIAIGK